MLLLCVESETAIFIIVIMLCRRLLQTRHMHLIVVLYEIHV